MKNKFLFAIITIIALSSASCKKTYTCSCTTVTTISNQGNSYPFSSSTGNSAYGEKMTKKQAQSACDHQAIAVKSSEDNAFAQSNAQDPSNAIDYKVATSCALK